MITVAAAEVITEMLAAHKAGTVAVAGITALAAFHGRVPATAMITAYDGATDAQAAIAAALLGWAAAEARDGDADGSTITGTEAEYARCEAGRVKLDALQGRLSKLVRRLDAVTGNRLAEMSRVAWQDALCRAA